jgi:hypothetical protein
MIRATELIGETLNTWRKRTQRLKETRKKQWNNWKSVENGQEDEVIRWDIHPNATQQTQTTEEQREEPNHEADLSVPTWTAFLKTRLKIKETTYTLVFGKYVVVSSDATQKGHFQFFFWKIHSGLCQVPGVLAKI